MKSDKQNKRLKDKRKKLRTKTSNKTKAMSIFKNKEI